MKFLAIPFAIASIGLISFLPSCQLAEGTGRAHFMIDSFYHCFDRGEYAHIVDNIVDPAYGTDENRQAWIDVLTEMEALGPCSERSKGFGFNTNITNGVTTVELNFTCTFEGGTTADEFVVQDAGKGYKIQGYHYKFTPNEEL